MRKADGVSETLGRFGLVVEVIVERRYAGDVAAELLHIVEDAQFEVGKMIKVAHGVPP